jgi:hypothetical protein
MIGQLKTPREGLINIAASLIVQEEKDNTPEGDAH